MKKVLYITSNNPWGIGGGSAASFLYLTVFLEVFKHFSIDLLVCKEFIDSVPKQWRVKYHYVNLVGIPPRTTLEKIVSVITGQVSRFGKYASRLIDNTNYEWCIFDRNDTAGTLINKLSPSTKTIVIHHNYEVQYFKDNASMLFQLAFLKNIREGEKRAFLNSNINIFLTKEDNEQFIAEYGIPKGISLCLGIFTLSESNISLPEDLKEKSHTLVMTGSLNNVQNIDSIRYFVSTIYPSIDKSYNIIIAGQQPTEEIVNLLKNLDNVTLIPNPAEMSNILRAGGIYICTTRLGSGIKVRIMEALKYGLPVISHEISARGYHTFIKDKVFFPFDSRDSFLSQFEKVSKLIATGEITRKKVSDSFKKNLYAENVIRILQKAVFSQSNPNDSSISK